MNPFDLGQHELNVKETHRNLAPSVLYVHAVRYEKEAIIAENGALVAYSGEKTGRSPKRSSKSTPTMAAGPKRLRCK